MGPEILRTGILHENASPSGIVGQHRRHPHSVTMEEIRTRRVAAILGFFPAIMHRDQTRGTAGAAPESSVGTAVADRRPLAARRGRTDRLDPFENLSHTADPSIRPSASIPSRTTVFATTACASTLEPAHKTD